jgi:hypothetical protein
MKHFTTGRTALVLLASSALILSMAPGASAWSPAKICKNGGWANPNLYNASTGLPLHFTNQGACLSYGKHGRTYSSLVFTATATGGGPQWFASGFGLMPGSTLFIHVSNGDGAYVYVGADRTGSVSESGVGSCGADLSAFATSTTSRGATITTPSLPSACG